MRAALCSGHACRGAGTTQTAVNRLAGARTQLAALVTAGAAAGDHAPVRPLIGLMPEATLAAVVIVYSIGLIKPAEVRAILEVRRHGVSCGPWPRLPGWWCWGP